MKLYIFQIHQNPATPFCSQLACPARTNPHLPPKKRFDRLHIGFHIVGEEKSRADAAGLCATVNKSRHNRHTHLFRDVIEAALPFTYLLARSLWRNDQNKMLRFLNRLRHLLHQSLRLGAIYRIPTTPAKKSANRPAEQFGLSHITDVRSQIEYHRQKYHKIPIGGMWRACQNKLWDVRHPSHHAPTNQSQGKLR